MSHNKLRAEKNCLNCGDTVEERYCPNCGQENIELHDTAIHLFIHFIQDIFHYEGKSWHTLRTLVRKPGQTAAEYLDGKRVINIHPIRFYILSSSVFFLLFFYVLHSDENHDDTSPKVDLDKRMFQLENEKKQRMATGDTIEINALITSLQILIDSVGHTNHDTTNNLNFNLGSEESNTKNLDTLPWLERLALKRLEERRKNAEGDSGKALRDFGNELLHNLPQLIFLSLPFFAFYLKILYFRSKRQLYVEHLIFSVYHYAYLYFLLCISIILSWISDKIGNAVLSDMIDYLQGFFILYLFIYLVFEMKRFYEGRWRYALLRYFILMGLMFFTIILLGSLVAVFTYLV